MNDISAQFPVESPVIGPRSNTGQKFSPVERGALVDFLTVVFSKDRLIERGITRVSLMLPAIFGLRSPDIRVGELSSKRWQFYRSSAVVVDADGQLVGRIGMDGNGDTVCISLSGAACKYVKNWYTVRVTIEALLGRISRCDVAYDDYDGDFGTVHEHEAQAKLRAFASNGCPPKTKFLDDHGGGTGCTLYVGSKGHKQLCIYEKGKQLGVTESPWVRYEARLYGKHCEVPSRILTSPMEFLKGSYAYLATLFSGIGDEIASAIEYTKRVVEASGFAMVKWARRQLGPTLYVLAEALGDGLDGFLRERVLREGTPTRFRRICQASKVPALVRETLNPVELKSCLS